MPADAKVAEEGPIEIAKGTVEKRKRQAALKADSSFVEGGSVLKIEVDILSRLTGRYHVAELIHSGKKAKFQYMVMSLLGESLNNLLKNAGKQTSMSTQLRVGIHVLHGLKQVHDAGFMHRDIKTANLAIGNINGGTDPQIVHILDFGLSREYVIKDGTDCGFKMRFSEERSVTAEGAGEWMLPAFPMSVFKEKTKQKRSGT